MLMAEDGVWNMSIAYGSDEVTERFTKYLVGLSTWMADYLNRGEEGEEEKSLMNEKPCLMALQEGPRGPRAT